MARPRSGRALSHGKTTPPVCALFRAPETWLQYAETTGGSTIRSEVPVSAIAIPEPPVTVRGCELPMAICVDVNSQKPLCELMGTVVRLPENWVVSTMPNS